MTARGKRTCRHLLVLVTAAAMVLGAGCDGGDDAGSSSRAGSVATDGTTAAAVADEGGQQGTEAASAPGTSSTGSATNPGGEPSVAEPVCGCGTKVCGDDGCGNSCGTCGGADAFCFGGSCQTDESCGMVDFTIETQTAYRMDDKGKERLRYEAVIQGDQFTDLEIVSNRIIEEVGSLSAGVHTLHVESLTDCDDVCVVAHMDCPKQECAFPYIATSGTLVLTSAGADAPRLTGTASELVFTQAYYDDKTRQYQILKKAETRCMPGFDIDVELEQIIIEPTDCTPEGTGTTLGTEIGDFSMTNCLGDTVQFHDNCGYEAVWVVAVADW